MTSRNEVQHARRILAGSFLVGVTLATVVALTVTWRTGAEPVTMRFESQVVGAITFDNEPECFRAVTVSESFDLNGCEFTAPESDEFPGAIHYVLEEGEGYNGYRIDSFPAIAGHLKTDHASQDRTIELMPALRAIDLDTGDLLTPWLGLPSEEVPEEADTDSAIQGWLFGDITTREPLPTLLEQGPIGIEMRLTVEPDDGAITAITTDWDVQPVVVSLDGETEDVRFRAEGSSIDVLPPTPDRSESLATIWGVWVLAIGAVVLVGGFVARVSLGAARKAEEGKLQAEASRSRMETLSHGFAHVTRSALRQIDGSAAMMQKTAAEGQAVMIEQIRGGADELKTKLDEFAELTGIGEDDA